jgi:hypothetical protein
MMQLAAVGAAAALAVLRAGRSLAVLKAARYLNRGGGQVDSVERSLEEVWT